MHRQANTIESPSRDYIHLSDYYNGDGVGHGHGQVPNNEDGTGVPLRYLDRSSGIKY